MLTAQGLYNHSTTTLEEEEAALFGMAWSLLLRTLHTKSIDHIFIDKWQVVHIKEDKYVRKL